MILPRLPYREQKRKKQIITFGGINYSRNYSEGELLESEGLTSEQFPCLTQRKGRIGTTTYAAPTALYARGKLAVVSGTNFYYDNTAKGTVTAGAKQMCTIGNKIIIFPDKKYYDTETGVFGSLGSSYTRPGASAVFAANSITFKEGYYSDVVAGGFTVLYNPSTDTVDSWSGTFTIDQSTGKYTYNSHSDITYGDIVVGTVFFLNFPDNTQYYKVTAVSTYETGETTYVDITYEKHTSTYVFYSNVADYFNIGDAVKISGCTTFPANNLSIAIIRDVEDYKLTFDDALFTEGTETGTLVVSRDIPDLDYVCEDSNRIWGTDGNTIFASALGDPFNFYYYDYLTIDSYAVAVGSEGAFTGCVGFGGGVLFFKENCVHKIIGAYPAAYSLYTYTIQGVQTGCAKSLAIINENLYYKGVNGFYVYSGGSPTLISANLGTKKFINAVAGTDGERYYVSMQDDDTDKWGIYVFDTRRGIWMRESETHAYDFAYNDGILYYLDAVAKRIYKTGQGYTSETALVWSATFCPFYEVVFNRKCYSKLYLRVELSTGSTMKAEISVDDGAYTEAWSSDANTKGTVMIPIIPTRCDKFSIRLSGTGEFIVHSLMREYTLGSEV